MAYLNSAVLRVSWRGTVVFWALAGLAIPNQAWSTHETDHRFAVSGYIRDKAGAPVKDARVQIRDLGDRTVDPVTVYADGSGFYKAILHLHDKNAGDAVQISVKDERTGFEETRKIRAEFKPGDRHTERQAKVDFPESGNADGPGGVVGTEDESKYWVYAAVGILVMAAIGVAVRYRYRQAEAGSKRRRKKR